MFSRTLLTVCWFHDGFAGDFAIRTSGRDVHQYLRLAWREGAGGARASSTRSDRARSVIAFVERRQ